MSRLKKILANSALTVALLAGFAAVTIGVPMAQESRQFSTKTGQKVLETQELTQPKGLIIGNYSNMPYFDHSGHCLVRFDVSPEGSPFNVDTYYCTSGMLERATKKSVLRWKFQPKIVNGRPTSMRGVENRVTFEVRDERGNILPEPNR